MFTNIMYGLILAFLIAGMVLLIRSMSVTGRKETILKYLGLVSFLMMFIPLSLTGKTPVNIDNLTVNLQQKYEIKSITVHDVQTLRPTKYKVPTLITAELEDGEKSYYMVLNDEDSWEPTLYNAVQKNPPASDSAYGRVETTVPVEEITK